MATSLEATAEGEDGYVYITDEDHLTPNNDEEVKKDPPESEDKLRILVLGKHGSGKSTLIKSFLGEGDDDEGSEPEKSDSRGSRHVDVYSTTMCGVVLEFYDTPGLGGPGVNDKKLLQQINSEVSDGFNLVLVCMRMDEEVDQSLVSALREISNVYGSVLWERTIFVLTFANFYSLNQLTYDDEKHSSKNVATKMTDHVNDFIEFLHKQLVKDPRWLFSIKESVFRDIPFCMAGIIKKDNKDRSLPTTQDWVQDLLVACMSQCTSETVTAPKMDQDKKRILVEVGTVGSTAAVGGAAGAFIGGTIGTVMFPVVGTVVGAGIGSLIGGGVGTVAGGGTVVGMRIADKKPSPSDQVGDCGSSTDYLLDRSKELLTRVKTKFKK